jgi:hypothetical protein
MPGKRKECSTCHKQMRSDNLLRHKNVCEGENGTILTSGSKYYQRKGSDLQLSRFANNMINNNQDAGAFNSTSIGNGKGDSVRNPDKVLTIHEAAKKLKIIPESDDESSDDDSVIEDEYESDNKDMETNEKEAVSYEDENYENITKDELKDRLYTSSNIMKVFEVGIKANKALSNIELLEYIRLLKVPKFRDVFHIDELPKRIKDVECGIVNLSQHQQSGTHWVAYAKIHENRIYFDSFGRRIPVEIQKYMKTSEEYKNDLPVITRNTDIVQRINTKICGHLCLFVLTSIMRENIPFPFVMDQLKYAFSEYYY